MSRGEGGRGQVPETGEKAQSQGSVAADIAAPLLEDALLEIWVGFYCVCRWLLFGRVNPCRAGLHRWL
jgi:hypothetical protein